MKFVHVCLENDRVWGKMMKIPLRSKSVKIKLIVNRIYEMMKIPVKGKSVKIKLSVNIIMFRSRNTPILERHMPAYVLKW